MQIRCMGCMKFKRVHPVCEHCGYDETSSNGVNMLAAGSIVGRQYTIGKVMDRNRISVTYLAWDNVMLQPVCVKEYCPMDYILRDQATGIMTSRSDSRSSGIFEMNRGRFLKEVNILKSMWGNPIFPKILHNFQQNGTEYIVTEYVEGEDLSQYWKRVGEPMTIQEIYTILGPSMVALENVHKAYVIHGNIDPYEIVIRDGRKACLMNMGAERIVVDETGVDDTANWSICKRLNHFSPPEVFQHKNRPGPWTDVYAMSAVIYYCLTGKVPQNSIERLMEDQLWVDTISGLNTRQRSALQKGLALRQEDRFASMNELYLALFEDFRNAN